ncbi:DUF6461 domain-containing protein [Nocardia bovistercoris]|uniref:Uncharacterized protein n=1 Tax=Nocardia bovistercoris TaxID=2785916 RepID=A0A931N7L7_9NOCA|nr:DUF6461 domain-containing protein [Nocardia bovistercoris]MBH0780878.1 hypothetical protein [Nocardia bovistercoris]
MSAQAGGLGWMYGRDLPLLGLTFARDVTARQLLERMGVHRHTVAVRGPDDFLAEFGDLLYEYDAYVVTAGQYGRWAYAWETGSGKCIEDRDLVLRASAGTAAVVLYYNEKPMVEFLYAEDGELVTGLNTLLSMNLAPQDRAGSDPHRFDVELDALGARLDGNEHQYGPLGCRGLFHKLAENLGVGIDEKDLDQRPVLSGRLRPPSA